MRAGFSDPQGPLRARLAPYAIPAALVALAFCVPSSAIAPLLVAAFVLANLFGVWPRRQTAPREVQLSSGPGYVDVAGAGLRSQRISAKQLTGATTARTASSVLLSLSHTGRDQPLTISVSSEADADRLRQALGIGHGGFGAVEWRTVQSTAKTEMVGRLLSAAYVAGLALLLSTEQGVGSALLFGFFLLPVLFFGLTATLAGALSGPSLPTVVMTEQGLRLITTRGGVLVPYSGVLDVDAMDKQLAFALAPPLGPVAVHAPGPGLRGLAAADREALVAQVMSAVQRANGLGPVKSDVASRVETLRRARQAESPREWLARLDMAGHLLAGTPGYRGQSLDAEDLWAVLEDPDADAELRAAAARILRNAGGESARPRIEAALAAVRDQSASRRLRIAIDDDVDLASQELAALDDEPARRFHVMTR